MKSTSKMITTSAAALLGFAVVGLTTPAVQAYEYCRTDVTSSMLSCSFSSMEQCQAMSSGSGGSCERDPFYDSARTLMLINQNGPTLGAGFVL